MPNDIELTLKITQEGDLSKMISETEKDLQKTKKAMQDYGKEVDKTVKKQTAGWDLSKLAITGALYAGIKVLKSFVNESLKAADAAGLLPAEFDKLEESSTRLNESVGRFIGQQGKGFVGWMADVKEGVADQYDAVTALSMAYEQGVISGKEYHEVQRAISLGQLDATKAGEEYLYLLEEQEIAASNLKQQMSDLKWAVGVDLVGAATDFETKLSDLQIREQELLVDIETLGESWRVNTRRGKEEMVELEDELLNVRDDIVGIQQAHEEQTDKMLYNLLQQQLAVDGLTATETAALQQYALNVGLVSQEELDLIEITKNLATQTGVTAGFMAEQMAVVRAAMDEPWTAVRGILSTLKNLTRQQWNIVVNMITSGGSSSVTTVQPSGAKASGEKVYTPMQHGGISRGGLTLVGEAGPELVNLPSGAGVTPNNAIIDYELLGSVITQNIVGPLEDMFQRVMIANG